VRNTVRMFRPRRTPVLVKDDQWSTRPVKADMRPPEVDPVGDPRGTPSDDRKWKIPVNQCGGPTGRRHAIHSPQPALRNRA
jgi:hypothetical protein